MKNNGYGKPVPPNETPDERVIRMLDTPKPTLKNPKKMLATLKKLAR